MNTFRIMLLLLIMLPVIAQAQTLYVTDKFEITMRSGASTSNNILSMLKSGQALTILEQDNETRYSLVETSSGKQGYVLTRFLDELPSGRDRYAQLKTHTEQLEAKITQLNTLLNEYKSDKEDDVQQITSLKNSFDASENELANLKEATRDTLRVVKQNETLKARINELDSEKQSLTEENAMFKDSTAMDWFIRGAGVSLLAFLIGIIVTRIRWKKRDSWGNY